MEIGYGKINVDRQKCQKIFSRCVKVSEFINNKYKHDSIDILICYVILKIFIYYE